MIPRLFEIADLEEGARRFLAMGPQEVTVTSGEDGALYVSADLPQTARVMVKDEDLCVHCGLCAERCPTGAWDMQKSRILVPYAEDEPVSAEPRVAAAGSGT